MADLTEIVPRVFTAGGDWTFPELGPREVPRGARVDVDVDDRAWSVYDTDDGDVERADASLRRFQDGTWRLRIARDVRTLASEPGSQDGTPPAEFDQVLLGIRAGAPLKPVRRVEEQRVTRIVIDATDALLGEVDVVRRSVADGDARHRIELVAAQKRFSAAVARRLNRSGAVEMPPAPSASATPRTVGDAVSAFVRDRHRDILRSDVQLRRGEDAVHATRVTIRRLRSVLRVVEVFDTDAAAALDGELSWLSGVLGAVRDTDVLRAHLAAAVRELPPEIAAAAVGAVVDAAVQAQADIAREALKVAMGGSRYFALMRELRAWSDAPPLTAAAGRPVKHLVNVAHKAERTMHKRIDAARSADERHRARKAAKRTRYVGEFVAELAGGRAADMRRLAERAKTVQTDLGDRQDAAVAADFVAAIINGPITRDAVTGRGGVPTDAAFGCGVLWAAQRRLAEG